MGQIISFIKKRLLGQFFYCIKKCFCRQREEKEDCDEHYSLDISTPELLDPLNYNKTDPCFKLHQNVSTTYFDPVEENRQDSAHVLNVDNLEERDVRDPEGWIRHYCSSQEMLLSSETFGSDPSSDNETDSSFRVHQNVSTTCFDPVEDNRQDSAYVLDVDKLEERDDPERWIRHYCSSHKMLLVGEGDFSFSASLARAFGSAINMVATSLDSTDFLLRNYKSAMSNIQELRTRGCLVLHGVDATKMANYYYLGDLKFDRVVYNFPHAGFRSGESGRSQIRRHQLLISLFFENAKEMINEKGEIHVRHKCNGFFLDWNLKGLASAVGLRLIQEVPFNFTDYPGYHTKYGFGGDKNFNCNPCRTYIFGLFPVMSVSPRKYYT